MVGADVLSRKEASEGEGKEVLSAVCAVGPELQSRVVSWLGT